MTEEHRRIVAKQFNKKVRETAELWNKLTPEEKQKIMDRLAHDILYGSGSDRSER